MNNLSEMLNPTKPCSLLLKMIKVKGELLAE